MSLDVYLELPMPIMVPSEPKIFVREDGSTKEISHEEWDEKYPDREPVTVMPESEKTHEVYSANITHNLGAMAREAGIYQHLWRPDELGLTKAAELIEPLEKGLETLISDPHRFRKMNPENGWGDYDGLVEFVRGYLAACIEHPEATVSVWR